MHRLARERAVVVVVDDLHHADETSARLLLRLQRRTRSAALLLVLNHADSWYAGGGDAFAAQPHRHVQLKPLSVEAITELMAGDGHDGLLPERIHELSAGNPLLVNALDRRSPRQRRRRFRVFGSGAKTFAPLWLAAA